VARGTGSDFARLSEEIREAGLLRRQPRYYALWALASLGFLAGALALVLTADSVWTVALAAVLLGIAIGQAGSFTHDNGHRAIVGPGRVNEALGLFFGNLVAGVSWSWWRDKHNAHHAHPNDPDLDPDFNIKLLAFTREQAGAKRGLARWVTKHQAPLFVFMLPFEALHLHVAGVKHLLLKRPRNRWLELTLLTVRTVVLLGALLAALPTGSAFLALAVSEATFGLYFGSIFAPNHKGMPTAPDADYLRRQVLTSRNVRPGRVLDLWFIGLNYQIEHHLFPTLPRNQLRAARRIVRRFCAQRDIAYVEVGLVRSWVEVLRGLSEASAGVADPVDRPYSTGVGEV
jgi:fatty acid desaturase